MCIRKNAPITMSVRVMSSQSMMKDTLGAFGDWARYKASYMVLMV